MTTAREIELDILAAMERVSSIEGVYSLADGAPAGEDAYLFAVGFESYGIGQLVSAHYAMLLATGSHAVTGRVLYFEVGDHPPTLMRRARRLEATEDEWEVARRRIAERRAEAERAHAEEERIRLEDLQEAFRDLTERIARAGGGVISASFAGILEIVPDPFPSPSRRRVLVVDDDPETERVIDELPSCNVFHARDGWTAIDHFRTEQLDLVVCAVNVGEFPGAKLYRMAVNADPDLASRFVFLAAPTTVANAPPASAKGRVLSRPLDAKAVLALLSERPPRGA